MSSIAAVADEAYLTLERSADARRGLETAVTLLGEAHGRVETAFEGSNDPEKAQLIGRLEKGREDADGLIGVVEAADGLVRTWIANEVGGAPAATSVGTGTDRPGSWRGRDAIGHARDAGQAIGRPPRREQEAPR